MEVRFLRQTGPDLLILSSSQFDPEATFAPSLVRKETHWQNADLHFVKTATF
jgi:hypothetical protein